MGVTSTSKHCILFADDSKTARAAARKVLQKRYTFIEAENGELAWQQIESNSEIDLVVADINMPDSNGFELLGKIRNSSDSRIANLPVVIITGVENSGAAVTAALKLGATDFISKPFKGVDLLCRCHSYISLNKKIQKLEVTLENEQHSTSFQLNLFEIFANKYLSFAKRHKSNCAFGCIEVDVLCEIHTKHSRKTLNNIQKIIDQRVIKLLRVEDVFFPIGVNCFGVVMPTTSQVKSKILLLRLIESIDVMSLEIGGSIYRLSAKAAVYIYNGFGEDVSIKAIQIELDDTLDSSDEIKQHNKIKVCGNQVVAASNINESVISESLLHVLKGDYHKIIEDHVKELSDRLSPFLQYANARCVEESGGDASE